MTRVLVVDDDATSRILLRAALRQANFDVGLAVDGEDALRQFRAEAWDLVMLDVEMPDLSGHEVCATMRALAGELLPIVMVTGMGDVDSVQKAYDSGATDFIAKPINAALIPHHVKYLLRAHQATLDLRSANARNAAILDALPDLLFEIDLDGRIIDCHVPEADGPSDRARDKWVGKTIAEALPAAAADVFRQAIAEAHETGRSMGRHFELKRVHGSVWSELSVSRKTVGDGQRPSFIVLSRDITERKEAERNILRLADFDSLTGLPNRRSFLERVARELRRAEHEGRSLAVLFMDLDGFKNVNDTLGHGAGDQVLQLVADRLRDTVRPSDIVSRPVVEGAADVEFARLGGDEFTALVLDLREPGDALAVARRIAGSMQRPFVLQGREVVLSTSIGIALYPDDGRNAVTLLKHADAAMYGAKESARGQYAFYSAPSKERLQPAAQ